MTTREQFGKYLLLKKLSEDPLGESFRAGLLGTSGMDRVTLLKIFNGQGIDGHRLWEAARARLGVQEVLKNPNLGEGLDLGELEGIPYVAYEYISGKDLATLLEQAARRHEILPPEHALLITERIAMALAAGAENRLEGERILHGFVVPQLVMISNEGETRLMGFEVSQALRGFAANPVFRQHFGRYLAPEALIGVPPDKADDIYSLGVVLFELLTGQPLPSDDGGGYAAVIDQARLAFDDSPLPEAIGALLKQSLVPRGERLNDVMAWHKTLSTWMFEAQYNPTTFNLAFFMHNVFRQEIERESQEMEVEKTMPVPVQQASGPLSGSIPTPAATPAAAEETVLLSTHTQPVAVVAAEEKSGSKTGLFVGLAAVVVAAAIAAGVFFFMNNRDSAEPPPPQPALQPPPPPEVPQGPSPEEIQTQISKLMKEQTTTMLEEQQAQYEVKLRELEAQLDETRTLAREQQQRELRRDEEAAEAERLAEEKRQAAEREAAAREAEKPEPPEVAAASPPPPAVAPPPPAPPPKPVPPPPPAKPQVRRGDLVSMGQGVKPPKPIKLQPQFPEMARRINRDKATVVVKVLVDENGKVLDTELVGEKVGFGFDAEALQAVKRASYMPATKDGVKVKMWLTLTVKFQH